MSPPLILDWTCRVTLGVYNQTEPWTDVRTLGWHELTEILTWHKVGPKEGTCIVPATFRGARRHKADADRIDVAFLDSDSGTTLEAIAAAVQAQGWAAVISSTHSHGVTRTTVSKTAWNKFARDGVSREAAFLTREKGLKPAIAQGARIVEEHADTVTFDHQPCPKFRVAIPLLRPWRAADYSSQEAANAAWKDGIEALAAALRLDHDQACTDTSRLFYLPRRPHDGPPAEKTVLEGGPCDLFGLPPPDRIQMTGHQPNTAVHPVQAREPLRYIDGGTGELIDLITWAPTHGTRFKIATALAARRPDVMTGYGVDLTKVHIRCVNADEHTKTGDDNATFVMDAGTSSTSGFVYHCRHAHCDGRDRLYFVRRMLEQRWLTVADLTDPEFLCESSREAGQEPRPSYAVCCAAAEALSEGSSPDAVTSVLRLVVAAKFDAISLRRVLDLLKRQTGLSLGDLKARLGEIEREIRGPGVDIALDVATEALGRFWQDGQHLIRAIDKSFWGFTGTHWRRWTDEQIKNRLLAVVKDTVDPDERDFNSVLNASFNLLIASCAFSSDVLRLAEEPLPVINCSNGELWVAADASVELRPHRFDSYLTYVLDVGYDPLATCPEFDRTVEEIFARSSEATEMVRHYLEFMGYAIQPRRDIACYFMMKGHGNNGKTKLIETIEKLTNAGCIFSGRLAEIEESRFLVGSLAGKLILLDDDIDTGTKLPDGLLKKLSERKLLTGELKFKDSFEFIATCLPVLLANNFPLCADLSYGQRRRAHIVPFDRVFSPQEDDRGLFPRIWQHELPGILNRAIEGLQRLRRRGAFQEPADCIRAKEEWLAYANPLVAFIEERCRVNASTQVPLSNFYNAFTSWAGGAGIRNIPARNMLKANLVNLGYAVRHTKYHSSVVFGLELAGFYPAGAADVAE